MRGAGKQFAEIFEKNYPESYKIVTDKERFTEYKKEVEELVKKSGINIRGIETH